MQHKKNISSILTILFLILFILSALFNVYLFSQRTDSTEERDVMIEDVEWTTHTIDRGFEEISFSYPAGWYSRSTSGSYLEEPAWRMTQTYVSDGPIDLEIIPLSVPVTINTYPIEAFYRYEEGTMDAYIESFYGDSVDWELVDGAYVVTGDSNRTRGQFTDYYFEGKNIVVWILTNDLEGIDADMMRGIANSLVFASTE